MPFSAAGGVEQSENNFLPNTGHQPRSCPSYRHEEPASPDICIDLLTGGFLVRVQAEEPYLSIHQFVMSANLGTAHSGGSREGDPYGVAEYRAFRAVSMGVLSTAAWALPFSCPCKHRGLLLRKG